MYHRGVWPILFTLPDWVPVVGGAPVFTYGLLLGLALLVGYSLAVALAAGRVPARDARIIYWSTGAVGWVGARFLGPWLAPASGSYSVLSGGGLAYGGVLAGLVALLVAGRARRVPVPPVVDAATIATALGIGLVRIGCLLHGCDHGVAYDGPLAIAYPHWDGLFPAGGGPGGAGQLVLPVQAVESLFCLVLFGSLLLSWRRLGGTGRIARRFFVTYGVGRFSLEWLRGDADRGENLMNTGLSVSQWLSLLVVVGALLAWGASRRRNDQQAPIL